MAINISFFAQKIKNPTGPIDPRKTYGEDLLLSRKPANPKKVELLLERKPAKTKIIRREMRIRIQTSKTSWVLSDHTR